VLDEAASLDTTSLGVLGQTAQVSVTMPGGEDDDELVEDSVVDGEIPAEIFEGVIEIEVATDAAAPGSEPVLDADQTEETETAEIVEPVAPAAAAVAPAAAAAVPESPAEV